MTIILKCDDFWADKHYISHQWNTLFNITAERNIPISLGFVGIGLEKLVSEGCDELKTYIQNKWIQPFNHSYWHLLAEDKREFLHTSKEYQIDSFYKTQAIIKKKLNYTNTCFGSVGNSMDITALRMLSFAGDIKYIYYYELGLYKNIIKTQLANKTLIPLNGYGLLEHKELNGTIINFNRFKTLFLKSTKTITITYQLHPGTWSDIDLEEFEQCIEWLYSKNHKFILPTDYK